MAFDKLNRGVVWLCLGLVVGLVSVRPVSAEDVEKEKEEKEKEKKKKPFKINVANFDKMRDPFTFFMRIQVDGPGQGPQGQKLLDEALDKYKIAERFFKERRFKDAELACSDGLEKTTEIKDPAQLATYEDVVMKLTRLKKAAGRMIKRYETEDALEKLKLEVSGVFAKVQTPQALVSFNSGTGPTSMIVRIGDKILDAGAKLDPNMIADAPTVREIQPRRVIIDFRGYKIELPISSDLDTTELVETPK